jgi:TolB-like protein
MKLFIILVLSIFIFTSCSQEKTNINKKYKLIRFSFFQDNVFNSLDSAIIEISKQLLVNMPNSKIVNNKIAITAFVNLDKLKETSSFGRVVAESLINDLHIKKFKILEFRQQESISIDNSTSSSTGEFVLTRDTQKMTSEIPGSLLLVGTYTVLQDKQIVINARIVDNSTLDVISTARVILADYDTCKRFNLCKTKKDQCLTKEGLYCKKENMHMIKEDCNKFGCQTNDKSDLY